LRRLQVFLQKTNGNILVKIKGKKLVEEMVEYLKKDSVYLGLCINRFILNHTVLLDSAIRLLSQDGDKKDRKSI